MTRVRPPKPPEQPPTPRVTSTRSGRAKMAGAQLNNHHLIAGVTNLTHGATDMAAVLAVVPPGAPTKLHMHPTSETILFMLEGWGATLVGPELKPIFHGPGDFVYIPAGTMHIGFNLSKTHRAVLTETRSHRHFNHDVELLPEHEAKALVIIHDLQDQFEAGTLGLPDGWRELLGRPYEFIA